MIPGKSTPELVLVNAIKYFFSYLGLICLAYFYLAVSIGGVAAISHPVSIAIEVLGAIEILFYLFWFLPYRSWLRKQRPAFPAPLSKDERERLFESSLAVTPDIELYVKKWMCNAPLEDLRRENLKEWLLWALFDRDGLPGDDDDELESYVGAVEQKLGKAIRPGWGPAKSLRLNFRRFKVAHHALSYYMIIGTADLLMSTFLILAAFRFYRQPRSKFITTFPLRPFTILSLKESAAPHFSYFCRPHKSKTHRPIIFIHGLGIGLAIYIPFLLSLPKDIGIIAIEVLPISSRITEALPLAPDQVREIGNIIAQQGYSEFTFIGHSYGTFFAKPFVDDPYISARMARVILMDPVAVLLHVPDVAYNAAIRKPFWPGEIAIEWAAAAEPDIAFTLAKRFCWRSHVIWRENLQRVPTTVVVGSEDCLVNSEAISAYVTKGVTTQKAEDEDGRAELQWTWLDRQAWGERQWTGQGLELYWLEGYDHGQSLLSPKTLPGMMKLIEQYCCYGRPDVGRVVSQASSRQIGSQIFDE